MARIHNDICRGLALQGQALATVIAYQHTAGGQEICGLCAVDSGGSQHFLSLINHAGEADHFEIAASEETAVRGIARQHGWRISAFVHTHLNSGPEMSEHDLHSFRRDTLPWVIIAISGVMIQQREYPRPIKSRVFSEN